MALRTHPSQATPAPGRPPARDMVWIPAGRFRMGDDHHYPEEAPAHEVEVEGFWMDRAPVTNAQFLKFVKATGHITLAEQPADPADYPGAGPDQLQPASIVFVPPSQPVPLDDIHRWWRYVRGANWRHPEGPGSSIKGRDRHPVVHIACADAEAYARWAGKRLPTEREWERAARGGLEGKVYAWGDALHPGGRPLANTWQGPFPHHNTCLDGFAGTSPVGSYPANPYGLVDMIGNVWEWTADWYRSGHQPVAAPRGSEGGRDGGGGDGGDRSGDRSGDRGSDDGGDGGCCQASERARQASIDPHSEHGLIPRRVVKGGSYLCAPEYCRRYRPAARMAQGIDTSTGHLGFRCVATREQP